MASNDYYGQSSNDGQQQYHQYYNNEPYNPQRQHTLPLQPPYPSKAPSANSTVSPFEAPFDDHVYPAPVRPQDSQYSFGQESNYYSQGGGGRPQDSNLSFGDEIPLQSNPTSSSKYNVGADHVYDVGESGIPLKDKRKFAADGGLGRLKKSRTRIPYVVYALTIVQIAVFIAEIVTNATLTGSPIEIHPSFNPMIGPSPYVLINMGARYVSCMHNVENVTNSPIPIQWPCPNSTTYDASDPSNQCTLSQLCGFGGGVPNPVPGGSMSDKPEPNQWFRFIVPIFLHAGIIHIGFNLLLQMTLGREMELAIGPIRFFLVYISSGIFGFVLGGNFAATGIASTGCSGALFGIIALNLLDLLYTWQQRASPFRDLAFIGLDVAISFVLGLLPGLDNFSHIGGFLNGLVFGICILHTPAALRRRVTRQQQQQDEPPYAPVGEVHASDADRPDAGVTGFLKNPVAFFRGRKAAWWAWWFIRAGALSAVLIIFILLLDNFYYYHKTCSWCKYLSCLPINNWCDVGNIHLTTTTTNTTSKRSVFDNWASMAAMYAVLE